MHKFFPSSPNHTVISRDHSLCLNFQTFVVVLYMCNCQCRIEKMGHSRVQVEQFSLVP